MSSSRDYQRGRQAGLSGMPIRTPRNAATAFGEAEGRAQRERNLRPVRRAGPRGETPKTVRVIVLVVAIIFFGPLLLIPVYLLAGLGVHAVAAAVGIVGLLLAWPLRKRLGSLIGLWVCLSAGLLASIAENTANNRPQTIQNLYFPMFFALVLGVAATVVLSIRRRKKPAG